MRQALDTFCSSLLAQRMRENKDMRRARRPEAVLPFAMHLPGRGRSAAGCPGRPAADSPRMCARDSSDAVRIEHLATKLFEFTNEFRIDIAHFSDLAVFDGRFWDCFVAAVFAIAQIA